MLNSGIQSKDGGFYAWYDLAKKSPSFVYSEITGYAITTLLFLKNIYNDDIYLERARKAASWITDFALLPCGGVRTRLYEDDSSADKLYSFSGENIFSFDLGMVLYGMINLYKVTEEKIFLESAIKMADFLLDKMQRKDGSFSAIYNVNTQKTHESFDKWSNQSGSFHSKVGLGLVDMFEVTKNKKYIASAGKICEYALTRQEKNGRFITNEADRTTNLHPHCYSIEGLLYAGSYLKEKKFIDSAKNAVMWIFDNLSSGKIDELYNPKTNSFNNFQRLDALSQSLRLGVIFEMDRKKLEELKNFILDHQYLKKGGSQTGGFLYSKASEHINCWCTMFALQALAVYDNNKLISNNKRLDLFV
jgi:uncharacterized protein YyaL (SSP411 family)